MVFIPVDVCEFRFDGAEKIRYVREEIHKMFDFSSEGSDGRNAYSHTSREIPHHVSEELLTFFVVGVFNEELTCICRSAPRTDEK